MVGLNDIVQILDLSIHRLFGAFAFRLQFRDGNGVGRCLVRVDDFRLLPILQPVQHLAEKTFCRFGVPGR